MTHSTVTIESMAKLANDLLICNSSLLDKVRRLEKENSDLQRKAKLSDKLLLILMKARDDVQYYADKTVENIDEAIAKAKEE